METREKKVNQTNKLVIVQKFAGIASMNIFGHFLVAYHSCADVQFMHF
jgi:hypothetical protein